MNKETNDLLLINDEYFVSSQVKESTITFINISNLEEDKIIKKVESIDSYDCFSLLRNYLIVNCKGGIAIILLETKELIRYIIDKSSKKLISYNNGNNFYIYTLKRFDYPKLLYSISVMKLEDNDFKLIKIYENNSLEEEKGFDFIIMNENTILILGNNIYVHSK